MLPKYPQIQVWVGHHNGPSARYCPLGKYPKWQRESMVATLSDFPVRAESLASHKRKCPSFGIELLADAQCRDAPSAICCEHAEQDACADADQRDEAARPRLAIPSGGQQGASRKVALEGRQVGSLALTFPDDRLGRRRRSGRGR